MAIDPANTRIGRHAPAVNVDGYNVELKDEEWPFWAIAGACDPGCLRKSLKETGDDPFFNKFSS